MKPGAFPFWSVSGFFYCGHRKWGVCLAEKYDIIYVFKNVSLDFANEAIKSLYDHMRNGK